MSRIIRALIVVAVPAALASCALSPAWGQQQDPYPLDLYVDAVSGLDSESCGAYADPCRSVQAAVNRIPHLITQNVTIHVGAGVYDGGILIADRDVPNGARITIAGEPGLTFIAAAAPAPAGIVVQRASGVTLENLVVEGFSEAGIKVLFSANVAIRRTTVAGNNDGVFLGESLTEISESSIQGNRQHGVSCEGGWVTLGTLGPLTRLEIAGNGVSGVRTDGCRATFGGPTEVSGRSFGLLAVHAGVIDLGMRSDISVSGGYNPEALMADCGGMILGYANACTGACDCTAVRYGVCEATSGDLRGGRRPPRVDDIR